MAGEQEHTEQAGDEAADETTPAFATGETPSEEELADPDVGGTAGGGPAGA